jgi:hypothetical protein
MPWYIPGDDGVYITCYRQQLAQQNLYQRQVAEMQAQAQAQADAQGYDGGVLYNSQRAQERIVERRTRDMARHRDDARTRARELLLRNLTPEQRDTLEKHKWFIVEGGVSKTRYRIHDCGHLVGNIAVLAAGGALFDGRPGVTHRLCGHLRDGQIPLNDNLLAQKLMLEGSEEEFLRLANRHSA